MSLFAHGWATQTAPSDATAIPPSDSHAFGAPGGVQTWVTAPFVVIRKTPGERWAANHMWPSGPTTIERTPSAGGAIPNLVSFPLVDTRAMVFT